MADVSDVEVALVNAAIAIAYPNGAASASAFGAPVRVYRGMPPSAPPAAAGCGSVDVSIYPDPDRSRDTTRWGVQVFDITRPPGVTVSTEANSATFAGAALAGDLAGILAGGSAYVYAAQAGDDAGLVAAVLADAIRATTICWLAGSTLSIPAYQSIVARTAAPANCLEEWARQEQDIRLIVRATTPQLRDSACSMLGAGLATITFLTLADGTGGRLRYRATSSSDEDQASSVYRRVLTYTVEYGTTVIRQQPSMLFGDLQWNGQTILV
jgi:hypothetical protein